MDTTTNPYSFDRREMAKFIPGSVSTLLDVGCANGDFGRTVTTMLPGNVRVSGIDPNPGADISGYDAVYTGHFPSDVPRGTRFDCIVFNDVLEHMIDPWSALIAAKGHLTESGVAVASIPNVRYWGVLAELAIGDRWEYRDMGILDRTHLRFFTATTIRSAFDSTGYTVDRLEPLGLPETKRIGWARRLTARRIDPFLTRQYAVVARPLR